MKLLLSLGAAAIAVGLLTSVAQAADVGVSVQINQPGFYGRIDLGKFPQPQVVYPQPVIIQPVQVAVVQAPIYLRVPPGHSKNWGKHCAKYNACGQPVYFVQEQWYQDQNMHGQHRGDRHESKHGKGHNRG
jgi:hypothetical protein